MKKKKVKVISLNDSKSVLLNKIVELEKKYSEINPSYENLCNEFSEFSKFELISIISYILTSVGKGEYKERTENE